MVATRDHSQIAIGRKSGAKSYIYLFRNHFRPLFAQAIGKATPWPRTKLPIYLI